MSKQPFYSKHIPITYNTILQGT